MPEISVIVPVYNVEKYLERCIDSILEQTFPDYELILVDDGSTDRSAEICDACARKDSRVKAFHHTNMGQAAARNFALDWVFANSESKYVSFVDSDDCIHPQMLEILLNNAIETNATVSVCGSVSFESETPPFRKMESSKYDVCIGKLFIKNCLLNNKDKKGWVLWDKLFSKSCFESIRMPVGRIYEDNAVIYKILYNADLIVDCNAPLYYYFYNSNSTTNRPFDRKKMDWLLVLEEMIDYFSEKPEIEINNYLNKRYLADILFFYRKAELISDNELCKELKRKLRKQYIVEKKRYPITIKTDPDLFNIIYPRFSRCYWLYSALSHKIKKG